MSEVCRVCFEGRRFCTLIEGDYLAGVELGGSVHFSCWL
jgi:hypothetical protein